MASTGSLSGALMGGLIFGVGMVLTRGCASRLLVLSAAGNRRALLSGLIFAVVAQASMGGDPVAPLRLSLSAAGGRWMAVLRVTLLAWTGGSGMWAACCLVACGWWRVCISLCATVGQLASGSRPCSPASRWRMAWWFSFAVASSSFEVADKAGLTLQQSGQFEWLMRVLVAPAPHPSDSTQGFVMAFPGGVLRGRNGGARMKLEGFKEDSAC